MVGNQKSDSSFPDIRDCRVKVTAMPDLMICLTDKDSCAYRVYFDRERFCIHPDNQQIEQLTASGS
jgi:hypothetical protein